MKPYEDMKKSQDTEVAAAYNSLAQGLFITFDDLKYLDSKQTTKLGKVLTFIANKKRQEGIPDDQYIVINTRVPWADKIMGLILAEEEKFFKALEASHEQKMEVLSDEAE